MLSAARAAVSFAWLPVMSASVASRVLERRVVQRLLAEPLQAPASGRGRAAATSGLVWPACCAWASALVASPRCVCSDVDQRLLVLARLGHDLVGAGADRLVAGPVAEPQEVVVGLRGLLRFVLSSVVLAAASCSEALSYSE